MGHGSHKASGIVKLELKVNRTGRIMTSVDEPALKSKEIRKQLIEVEGCSGKTSDTKLYESFAHEDH
jgi:hypothetical protein